VNAWAREKQQELITVPSLLPRRAVRKLVVSKRLRFHLDAVTRIERRRVITMLHYYGKDEVFVQMIDVLNDSILKRSTDRDVIEERQMLNVFAKPDSARMRTNRTLPPSAARQAPRSRRRDDSYRSDKS